MIMFLLVVLIIGFAICGDEGAGAVTLGILFFPALVMYGAMMLLIDVVRRVTMEIRQ